MTARSRGRRWVLAPAAAVLVAVVALGACADSGEARPDDRRRDGARSARAGGPRPVVSYAPTCTGAGEPGCLSGTEVQALEAFDGKLYAGTTSWMETLPAVWPRTSAQVNVLASRDGTWRRTPDLPGSPKCAPGVASWEQVNDLHAVRFASRGTSDAGLFAGVLANEDGACPGLQATVFALDAREREWVDTGLGARLERWYGSAHTEVRYVESFGDGSADCRNGRPCLFAFVGPRSGRVGPSAWRGVHDPARPGCELICWDAEPEVVMDGVQAPAAARIVAATSGDAGLFFGTVALGRGRCPEQVARDACTRAALMQRVGPGRWEPAWRGVPVTDGGPDEVRGIASWTYRSGDRSLWFVTAPAGTVYRIDTTAGRSAATVVERTLGEFLPSACKARMLPYQLALHPRGSSGRPELVVASQSCGYTPRDSFARIFHRPVAPGGVWTVTDLLAVTNVGSDRSNEAAVRWIEPSPFDPEDLFFGTTDMNNTPGSLTARVYRLAAPFG